MIRHLLILILLYPLSALAVSDLVVKEKINVYDKPNSKAKKVSQLSKGDVVVISPKSYGSYRKVLVTYDGKRQGGYIPKKEIILSVIEQRTPEETNDMTHRKSVGAVFGIDFAFVMAGQVEASGFPQAQSENLFGFDFFVSLNFNLPIGTSTLLELSATKRSISYSGDVEFITGGGIQQTDVMEKGYAAGLFTKFYSERSSIFWKGVGLEAFQITDVEISANNGQNVPFGGEKAIYIAPVLGIGWDIQLTETIFLSPDVRFGAYATRSPIAIFADARLVANFTL